MNILAIDPGNTESAFVLYDTDAGRPVRFAKVPNGGLLGSIRLSQVEWSALIIERVACMGMSVGEEVFETVDWSGRFREAAESRGRDAHRIKRHEVKQHLCGNQRAKDKNIRQALLDRFGPGKEVAIGTKKNPGPLYGVAGDVWAALAVAVTWADTEAGTSASPRVTAEEKRVACLRGEGKELGL